MTRSWKSRFPQAIRRPTRRPLPAAPKGRRRSLPSPTSRRDGADPGRAAIAVLVRYGTGVPPRLRRAIFTVQKETVGRSSLMGRQRSAATADSGISRPRHGGLQRRAELDPGSQGGGNLIQCIVTRRSLLKLQKNEAKRLKNLSRAQNRALRETVDLGHVRQCGVIFGCS